MISGKWLRATVLGLFWLGAAHAAMPDNPVFDVASIKPSDPGETNGMIKALPSGRGYLAKNIPLKLMISLMYRVPVSQIRGAPDWVSDSRFDIEARTENAPNKDELQAMFKSLMADRFNLKMHTETETGPVYALTVDETGSKMKENFAPQDFEIPINGSPAHTVGKRVPMKYLCWWLGLMLQADGRQVIDKTGLDGNYDFTLSYAPQLPPNAKGAAEPSDFPTIFTALKEQLGLRLHAEKGPVQFLVVDHVEKPSAD